MPSRKAGRNGEALPTKAKEKAFNLTEFNKGFPRRELKEGDQVTIYRVPYRNQGVLYRGTVVKIHNYSPLSAYCDIKKNGTESIYGESVYLGRIWEGWQKP